MDEVLYTFGRVVCLANKSWKPNYPLTKNAGNLVGFEPETWNSDQVLYRVLWATSVNSFLGTRCRWPKVWDSEGLSRPVQSLYLHDFPLNISTCLQCNNLVFKMPRGPLMVSSAIMQAPKTNLSNRKSRGQARRSRPATTARMPRSFAWPRFISSTRYRPPLFQHCTSRPSSASKIVY